jgi:hypothetical protein
MALRLQPGMHAVVERLSNGRYRINWRLVGWHDVSALGGFESAEGEVRVLLAQWNARQPCAAQRDPGRAR